jgi:dephospho-CoA kinase
LTKFRSPEDVQLERLRLRNALSEEQAKERIKGQIPIEQKKNLASYVIYNTGALEESYIQAENILNQIDQDVKSFQWVGLSLIFLFVVCGSYHCFRK